MANASARVRFGIAGRVRDSQANVAAATGTTQKKAPRQPMYCPRKLPSGAATVVARALPPLRMASPRGTSSAGTRRITVAADIDQNPPITMPTNARPPRNTAALGAKATARPETSISTVSPSRSARRSSRGVAGAMNRLVSTANTPETAMA